MATNRPMRQLARQRLDERLKPLRTVPPSTWATPKGGWIRAIREALGMPRHALGELIGVGDKRIAQLERGEARGALTMTSLARAAQALDCELVVALLPREPLEAKVQRRRAELATDWLKSGMLRTMALEGQAIGMDELPPQIIDEIQRMFPDERLWDAP